MRYYLIDEIAANDMERLTGFFRDNAVASGLDKVFWINIPENCLNETQIGHADCHPYFFAVELGSGMLKAEFYVRTLRGFNCTCSGFPDDAQTRFVIRFVDGLIRELKIRT
jgi:hypothetical protein